MEHLTLVGFPQPEPRRVLQVAAIGDVVVDGADRQRGRGVDVLDAIGGGTVTDRRAALGRVRRSRR